MKNAQTDAHDASKNFWFSIDGTSKSHEQIQVKKEDKSCLFNVICADVPPQESSSLIMHLPKPKTLSADSVGLLGWCYLVMD